jgi:hypothetical protein
MRIAVARVFAQGAVVPNAGGAQVGVTEVAERLRVSSNFMDCPANSSGMIATLRKN